MPTPTFRRWDVVAVPFPYTEGDQAARRPTVVVSGDKLAQQHGLYWVVMITSAVNPSWPDDVRVSESGRAGLPVPSVVRPAKIATIQHDRIIRRLGALPAADRATVQAALRRHLG